MFMSLLCSAWTHAHTEARSYFSKPSCIYTNFNLLPNSNTTHTWTFTHCFYIYIYIPSALFIVSILKNRSLQQIYMMNPIKNSQLARLPGHGRKNLMNGEKIIYGIDLLSLVCATIFIVSCSYIFLKYLYMAGISKLASQQAHSYNHHRVWCLSDKHSFLRDYNELMETCYPSIYIIIYHPSFSYFYFNFYNLRDNLF